MTKHIYIILLLLVSLSGYCQNDKTKTGKTTEVATFKPYRFKTLNYQLLAPATETGKKYPLVVFLHGAGERGSDNRRQLTYIDTIFQSRWFQAKYPSFVLAPQCPKDKRWVEVDWSLPSFTQPARPSEPLRLTLELIDTLIEKYPVDTNRIYIMGLSMGGFGTWDALARQPYRFAAAIPICGGADTATACKIAHIPVWVFHGAKDNVVPVVLSRNMVRALRRCGGSPVYTEYPNVRHGAWFKALANRKIYDWLFEQTKNETR